MKYFVTGKISENIAETPEGYLICIGVPIARTGEQEYGPNETPLDGGEDGHVIITRDEKEVFRPETIASFEGKSITISHPDEFVSPDNWKDLSKGVLQNVRRGKGEHKDDLLADLLITDSMAIGLVRNGMREVSCGYEADYVQTEKGRGMQTNIIGNHLALVDEGRAGPQYAINDHKGDKKMNLKDRIKAIFAKAQDEAMKMADEEGKEDKKDDKSKDEKMAGYDELVKMVDAIGEKITKLMGAKDQAEGESENKEGLDEDKEESKDADEGLEARLKACEAALEKLLSKSGDEEEEKAEDEDEEETGDEEESEDEDMEDEDMEDDDFEESTMVGDSADDVLSRAEILAPGIKKSKDIKARALKTAYGTTDGKKVIDSLTGGKAPKYDSKEVVNTLFIAASEVLKAERSEEFSKTKRPTKDTFNSFLPSKGDMTAEKMNELNAKHYAKRA